MDFKKEEYRKKKQKKANAKRIQKKKEIRLGVRAVTDVHVGFSTPVISFRGVAFYVLSLLPYPAFCSMLNTQVSPRTSKRNSQEAKLCALPSPLCP